MHLRGGRGDCVGGTATRGVVQNSSALSQGVIPKGADCFVYIREDIGGQWVVVSWSLLEQVMSRNLIPLL